ncbi:MAG: cytochrome c oxidase assembly protein [Chloroflexota bacterium]|nr:cytochrome c oxidase assembly protein [Dehalococcoidia bacterium]MDW8253509.1 cytochrome c oxidase assembly protein [Chloroflexota bacterium]
MDPYLAALLSWSFDPLVIGGLALLALLYWRGARRLATRGGLTRHISGGQLAAAIAGWLSLVFALVSPLAVFSSFFLSAHMAQHLILTQISAPLVLMGRPVPTLLLGLPRQLGRDIAPLLARDGPLYAIGSALVTPPVALLVFLLVFFGWHVPVLYDAAIRITVLHDFQHLTFFWAAILFWWGAVDPVNGRNQRRRFLSLVTIALAFMAANALGIWFTFTPNIIYPSYEVGPQLFGVSSRDDQIVGGLVMWVAGSLLYAIAALVVLGAAMHAEERAARRREAQEAALA